MNEQPLLQKVVNESGVAALFVTLSGAHLYGFPSPDSDFDLRGCHRLPLSEVVGLKPPVETIDRAFVKEGREIDLVSHDVGKYLRLLSGNNGYVLEQVFSPLVIQGESFLQEVRSIARRCITRFHYYHYRGFVGTKRRLLEKAEAKSAKDLLYAYRVLMTGTHLLRTGEVEANIVRLNERFRLPFIDDLIAQKIAEKIQLPNLDWEFHQRELDRLEKEMEAAFTDSTLPEERDHAALHDLLVRVRLGS
jgi:predicted nucleotidyltransferase